MERGNRFLHARFRVGPAYPLIFQPILYPFTGQKLVYPTTPQSTVGARWVEPFYQPEHVPGMTNCGRRIAEDVKIMGAASEIWAQGTAVMRKMLAVVPESKRLHAEKMVSAISAVIPYGQWCM